MEKQQLFTLTTLAKHLNEHYKKKSGGEFSISDVQGYVQRGYLPLYLEDQKIFIQKVEGEEFEGLKLYKLVKKYKDVLAE